MSQAHEGYTDAELQTASQNAEASQPAAASTGYRDFASFAESLPEVEQPVGTESAADFPEVNLKKIKADMRKIKKILGENLPEAIFHAIAVRTGDPRWELDYNEKQNLSESVSSALEVFGLEFQFEQKPVVVRSRLWALLLPALSIASVLLAKFAILEKNEKSDSGTDRSQGLG